MAITTAEQLLAAYGSGNVFQSRLTRINSNMTFYTASIIDSLTDLWVNNGSPTTTVSPLTFPNNGTSLYAATSGALNLAGASCNSGTTGAMLLPSMVSNNGIYAARLTGYSQGGTAAPNSVILYDRVWANNFDATVTTVQTVNSAAWPRYTSGKGLTVFLTFPCSTAGRNPIGISNAFTVTLTYTNSAGISGQTTTISVPSSSPLNFEYGGGSIPFTLASGDLGVMSVQSIQMSSKILNAGFFPMGLIVGKMLGVWPGSLTGIQGSVRSVGDGGLIPIIPSACLMLMTSAASVTANNLAVWLSFTLDLVQG